MMGLWFRALSYVAILVAVSAAANGSDQSPRAISPLHEIRTSFPGSIKLRADGERSIEFCPDNT